MKPFLLWTVGTAVALAATGFLVGAGIPDERAGEAAQKLSLGAACLGALLGAFMSVLLHGWPHFG